jgi:hypothetical protein
MGITRFHPLRTQRGITTMSSLSADDESGFESEVPNLCNVPLGRLRRFSVQRLRPALLHVVQQTEQPSKTETSCSKATPID